MFERYLTNALTQNFGHVIEGLDADKIRLSAWNGELVLQHLTLRSNALDHWLKDCPVEIAHGRVGNLEIRIPWSLIRPQFRWKSSPTAAAAASAESSSSASTTKSSSTSPVGLQCSVVLSDVNILVIPRKKMTRHESFEEQGEGESSSPRGEELKALSEEEQRRRLEKAVQEALDAKLLQRVAVSSPSAKGTRRWQWIQMRVAEIISNLSVTIRNIHIRYEDPGTSMGFSWNMAASPVVRYRPPFAIGLTLRRFTVQSDAGGGDGGDDFTDKTRRHKIASAQELAAYWDSDCHIVSNLERLSMPRGEEDSAETNDAAFYEEAFKVLSKGGLPSAVSLSENSKFQPRHAFVLDPLSPKICLELQSKGSPIESDSSEKDKSLARPSSLDVTVPPCHLNLSRTLLEDVGYLKKSASVWKSRQGLLSDKNIRRLAKLRPKTSPRTEPASWWRYAKEAVIEFQRMGIDSRTYSITRKRPRGWLGLAQTIGRRNRYLELYRKFLSAKTREVQQETHKLLLDMENELLVEEIVAFRIAACANIRQELSELQAFDEKSKSPSKWQWKSSGKTISSISGNFSSDPDFGDDDCLSVGHRSRMFAEMLQVFDREDNAESERTSSMVTPGVAVWMTSLKCPEFSVQVNDTVELHHTRSDQRSPVVRLSCAFLQEQVLFQNGSWEMTNRVGALVVKDCISAAIGITRSQQLSEFPYLLGPKAGIESQSNGHVFELEGQLYRESMMVRLQRILTFHDGLEMGSTTTTQVRVLPLEVVYATKPVEALARILSTANLELADDYHRISSRLAAWKQRQQERLLKALAHKKKTILVDIDVGAPVLLFPESEREKSMMLVIDLGRLSFRNEDRGHVKQERTAFDDKWNLELASTTMLCCLRSKYRYIFSSPINEIENARARGDSYQRLIEPFSIVFSIGTKVMQGASEGQTYVHVDATLPRLAFNMTSSAVRLIRRLQMQWKQRKLEVQPKKLRFSHLTNLEPFPSDRSRLRRDHHSSRKLEFQFSAPLFRVKLDNDVDGRLSKQDSPTPLLDLSLRGLESTIKSEKGPGCAKIHCEARVRTLTVTDLYQCAGSEFAPLVSSVSPALVAALPDLRRTAEQYPTRADLVTFEYSSVRGLNKNEHLDPPADNSNLPDKLEIRFHELYVEWNPETIAAIHYAIQVPVNDIINVKSGLEVGSQANTLPRVDEDEFFDAIEEDFYDAASIVSEESNASHLISEISESRVSSYSDLASVHDQETTPWRTWQHFGSPVPHALAPPTLVSSPWPGRFVHSPTRPRPPNPQEEKSPFIIAFNMSKLSVNFNKEARHRRVWTAEMDGAHLTYTKRPRGGYEVSAVLGNLTFADPSSLENKTLYREILGLKTDTHGEKPSSLLEMKYKSNPRSRMYFPPQESVLPSTEYDGVVVDFASGSISGFDNNLEARLSPMRFVYLHQLWTEIIDYFFEGIVGFEVWGNVRPPQLDPSELEQEASDSAVEKIGFTLFNVHMDSPVILFPVAPCSTDFVRLKTAMITFSNRYKRRPMRLGSNGAESNELLMQWFNNCDVLFQDMILYGSSGALLTVDGRRVDGSILLNWPTGTTARMNVPKWKVHGTFDPLTLRLRREDFALLQSVVGLNLGETSRHMEEWFALQALPTNILDQYLEEIFVKFGYDQKDVTPTTFDVSLGIPAIKFLLERESGRCIAETSFSQVSWEYKKHADLISRQKVTCDVGISNVVDGSTVPMLSGKDDELDEEAPTLLYTSTTLPSGDNSRTVDISNPQIFLLLPAWKRLSTFFQSLPDPSFLAPDEVIQVGDRWYRIGSPSPRSGQECHPPMLTWIPGNPKLNGDGSSASDHTSPAFEFTLFLRRPRVSLGNDQASLVLTLDGVDYFHNGRAGQIRRKFDIKHVAANLYDSPSHKDQLSQSGAFIRPWSVSGSMERCNGHKECMCPLHSARVTSSTLDMRLSYTDLTVAIDVFLFLKKEIQLCRDPQSRQPMSSSKSIPQTENDRDVKGTRGPQADRFHFLLECLALTVIDDSGRHFAGSQDLLKLVTNMLDFRTEKRIAGDVSYFGADCQKSTHLRVQCVTAMDCLQVDDSPFRCVMVLNPPSPGEIGEDHRNATNWSNGNSDPGREKVHGLEVLSLVKESNIYRVIGGNLEVQYNPCLVIAVQRFLGRLMKHYTERKEQSSEEGVIDGGWKTPSTEAAVSKVLSSGTLEVGRISICLNKEHQQRRLAQAVLTACQLDLEKTENSSCFSGHVKDFISFTPIGDARGVHQRALASSRDSKDHFVSFNYRTFKAYHYEEDNHLVSEWLTELLRENGGKIDDFLEVSVATMEAHFLREPTEELIDYLSNGMPGRGMGATSRAAKGFVADRIQKKSYLRVIIDTPHILIPASEGSREGLSLQLGDLRLLSWIEQAAVASQFSRKVSMSLKGVECNVYNVDGKKRDKKNVFQRIDVSLDIVKDQSSVSVVARLSDVGVHLCYSDYTGILRVLKENLAKKIDKQAWDNLEAQWELESSVSGSSSIEGSRYSADIMYASSARHVRYGQSNKVPQNSSGTTFSFRLTLATLSLVLRRDDVCHHTSAEYDMLLVRGQDLEVVSGSTTDGDISLSLALRELYAFDLGERGRALRDKSTIPTENLRRAMVMLEGYLPPEKREQFEIGESFDSHLVLKVDKEAASHETRLTVVVSYLSVSAVQRSLQDIVSFLACEWTTSPHSLPEVEAMDVSHNRPTVKKETKGPANPLQVRFIMHYPRFVFVADENDVHSRALVLRGLAIATASLREKKDHGEVSTSGTEHLSTKIINADFQNISSHILSDVSDVLSPRLIHLPLLGDRFTQADLLTTLKEDDEPEATEDVGIPLLLPLTMGLEYEQTATSDVPLKQSVSINVDPLSILISREDVLLVESVVRKWSSKPKNSGPLRKMVKYDAFFHTDRLGLGLRKESIGVVVDNVKEPALSKGIRVGDIVISIDGVLVGSGSNLLLADVVDRLANSPRPLCLTLSRPPDEAERQRSASDIEESPKTALSMDFSLSSAVLTFVEKDIPLLRGELLSAKVGFGMIRETDITTLKVSISASIAISYHNLIIWEWEQVLEQGKVAFSAEFQDPHSATRQLTIELGDGQDGLALNITDAAAETISKAFQWAKRSSRSHSEGEVFDDLLDVEVLPREEQTSMSRNAVNAALQYARRKRYGSAKPFVFRNRTGLSVALVQQERKASNQHDAATHPFLAVGDYKGLENYDSSQITIVGNGEEYSFRVEVAEGETRSQNKFPALAISLQSIGGVEIEPLVDLQIHRPGEALFSLVYHKADQRHPSDRVHHVAGEQLVVWRIEQAEEKTIISLGGSVQILSVVSKPIEMGIQLSTPGGEWTEMKSIGFAYAGSPFSLPIWLGMQDEAWKCSVRIDNQHSFSHLFSCLEDKKYDFAPLAEKTVGFTLKNTKKFDVWLSSAVVENSGVLTVTLDSLFSLQNLLPTAVKWEIKESSTKSSENESNFPQNERVFSSDRLQSGEETDILARVEEGTVGRFRPMGVIDWSEWIPLSIPRKQDIRSPRQSSEGDSQPQEDLSTTRYAHARDAFGVVQTIAVRVSEKECGLNIVIYAELWCINCSPLDVSFGCRSEEGRPTNMGSGQAADLSAAEAALKEISSLFESGQEGTGLRQVMKMGAFPDAVRLPGQTSPVVEEAFEYCDTMKAFPDQLWWASENAFCRIPDPTKVAEDGDSAGWFWVDNFWQVDKTGRTSEEGWESSSDGIFPPSRSFHASHRFRRRRWFRKRSGASREILAKGIHAFYQPNIGFRPRDKETKKTGSSSMWIAVQVNGGQWALSTEIPRHGSVYGATRARASRWPRTLLRGQKHGHETEVTAVFEFCYQIKPLDGIWGEFSRLMLINSRFLVRNDSKCFTFEVKQTGVPDAEAILVRPGERIPFHWSDCRRPELVCVRPVLDESSERPYCWSGGFDPLTIGAVPLRIRQSMVSDNDRIKIPLVRSIKMEAEIRPRTGGTGINLSFQEEDPNGDGALFRMENLSTYPIWVQQDGVLANPSWGPLDGVPELDGIVLHPSETTCFALDVPFRQGKYPGRKAATMTELLRLRLGLAPLTSRAGIETTKVISLAKMGDRVRLNPSKLMFLAPRTRAALEKVRVLGMVCNDGPTTVLSLRLMEKDTDNLLVNPFKDDSSVFSVEDVSPDRKELFCEEIISAAEQTIQDRSSNALPTEKEASRRRFYADNLSEHLEPQAKADAAPKAGNDLQISLRMAMRGIVISLVDSAPSEIAVITLKNVNAIASWNVQRTTDATVFITVTSIQVDNMIPNSPFPVAICVDEKERSSSPESDSDSSSKGESPPVVVLGLSFAPKHKTGIVCLKSATLAPRNLAVRVDLAFLVRLQKFALDLQEYFRWDDNVLEGGKVPIPDIKQSVEDLEAAAVSGVGRQKYFFGGLTILPWNVRLSVAPARALTPQQAALEGSENAAIHQAVRKGDVRLNRSSAEVLGVKVGSRNSTAIAVARGIFKSIVVDALLRLDGASLNFSGVTFGNHISTRAQLTTQLGAHYLTCLRQNLPALLGSLAALGNPIGLVRGLGDGVSDFVLEPVKGFQRSVEEMNASYLVDGVARGTLSLARHTVGGFADSAAMLSETFSKNMAVLTLDRRYAQKRDRGEMLRDQDDINVALGLGSGVQKLVNGFLDGVTGVVKKPLQGAEKKGLEGFAKGIGKGLLGLLVKPIIGISDGIADVMIGVKGSVDGGIRSQGQQLTQVRPRRAFYGRERIMRPYNMVDAAASALMMRTRLAGEAYLNHLEMQDRVALFSVKRLLLLGSKGQELLVVKYKHIESVEVRRVDQDGGTSNWSIVILLNTPRNNGSDIEVITCKEESQANELCSLLKQGMKLVGNDFVDCSTDQ